MKEVVLVDAVRKRVKVPSGHDYVIWEEMQQLSPVAERDSEVPQ